MIIISSFPILPKTLSWMQQSLMDEALAADSDSSLEGFRKIVKSC